MLFLDPSDNFQYSKTVKKIQTSVFYKFNEYEKLKENISKQNIILPNMNSDNNNNCNKYLVNFTTKFSTIIYFVNEIRFKLNERTLELILFKNFIGNLSIKKILGELLIKNSN